MLQDCHDSFIAPSSSKLDFVFDAMSGEIMALAQNVGCCLDSLDVIPAMQDGGYSNGAAAAIFL